MFIRENIQNIDIFQKTVGQRSQSVQNNIELFRIIVEQSYQGVQSSIEGKSTSAEGQQYDLADKINTTLKPIINTYKMLIFLRLKKRVNPLSAWTVLGAEGCYHTVHRHNKKGLNHLSTVLYLNTAESTEKDDEDSRGCFYYFEYINNDINIVTIKPEAGDLFIFPIDTYHGSYPQAKGLRQTLNIDFEILG